MICFLVEVSSGGGEGGGCKFVGERGMCDPLPAAPTAPTPLPLPALAGVTFTPAQTRGGGRLRGS